MNGLQEYVFKTNTGACRLTSKTMILTHEGLAGKISTFLYGTSTHRVQADWGGLGLGTLAVAAYFLGVKSYAPAIFLGAVTLYAFYTVVLGRSFSVTNQIDRAEFSYLTVHYPSAYDAGYVVIHFARNGKPWKRMVKMRGAMFRRSEEFNNAIAALRQAGWWHAR